MSKQLVFKDSIKALEKARAKITYVEDMGNGKVKDQMKDKHWVSHQKALNHLNRAIIRLSQIKN